MCEPSYVLKFEEGTPVSDKASMWRVIRGICIAVFCVIIFGSFAFRSNLLKEMSSYSVITLFALFICSFIFQRINWIASEVEWSFYQDKMIIYRDKRVYSDKKASREWTEVYYDDIKEFKYRVKSERLSITCRQHAIVYDYNRDGSLKEKPSYDKTTDSGFIINLQFIKDLDIVKEIETHSPIKVLVENS